MEFRPLVIAAAMIALAFSGCAGNETTPFVPSEPVGSQHDDGNHTVNETLILAPVVDAFEANTTGLTAWFFGNGTAPNATWAIDADGNGTDREGVGLPFVANFTFAEAGNYTALLTVSEGNLTTNATLELVILGVAMEAIPDPIVFSGAAIAPDPYYVGSGNECLGGIFVADSTGARHDFDIALAGLWVYEIDNDGFTTLFTGPDSYTERDGGTLGVIPGNSNRVYVCSHDAADEGYTMTLYHPMHPDAPAL